MPMVALVAFGATMGGLVVLWPGSACMVTVLVAVGLALNRWSDPADRRFLVRLYTAAMVARIIMVGVVHLWAIYHGMGWVRYGYASFDVFGDSAWTSLKGWLNALVWLGQLDRYTLDRTSLTIASQDPYVYLYAVFHWLFGFSQVAVKFINSLLGVTIALIAYDIVRDLAGRREAAIAAGLIAFFPSAFLWSLGNLKDVPNSLGVIWAYWAMRRLIQRGLRATLLLHLVGAVGFLHIIRPPVAFATSLCILLGVLWSVLWGRHGRVVIAGLMIMTLAVFYVAPNRAGVEPTRFWHATLESQLRKLVGPQVGQTSSEGSSYQLYDEQIYRPQSQGGGGAAVWRLTLSGLAWAFIKGWGYFLLAPAPWALHTLLQAITVPEMMVWYVLLVLAAWGAWRLMRAAPVEGGMLVAWIIVLSSLNALTTGNVGVAFRHRSLVIPFYVMLSAIGLIPAWEWIRRSRAVTLPLL